MNFQFSISNFQLPSAEAPPACDAIGDAQRGSKIEYRCNGSGAARTARLSKSPKAFTLIELLIVIAIIAILAALTLNTAGFIQKKAARARAETEIAALSAALESYKVDNGDYPTGTNTTTSGDNAFLRSNLSPASGKVYFEFSKTMGDDLTSGPVVDPFGENYLYQYPGSANRSGTNFFDLWSQAAAGSVKSNKWVKNW